MPHVRSASPDQEWSRRSGDPLFSDELGRHLFLRLGKLSTYKSPVYHLRNKEGRRTKPLKPNDWDDED